MAPSGPNFWMRLAAGAPFFSDSVLRWLDSGGGFLANAGGTEIAPVASWAQRTTVGMAPAGAAFVQIQINCTPQAANDAIYVDDVTLTQITGGTQQFTVTRSVNGVVKAQSSGAAVALFQPMILSM